MNPTENSDNNISIANIEDKEPHNSLYQDQLKSLICGTFGFDQEVLDRVVECSLDIESLLVISDRDINDLFPVNMLGIRAKFKYHLNIWRRKADTISVSTSCREWINSCSSPSDQYPLSPPSSSEATSNFNLLAILKQSGKGINILNYYNEYRRLESIQQEDLISIIIDSFTNQNRSMSMSDIINCSNAIINLFPSEDIEYYYKNRGQGLNPIGKLHDKAANARVKLRKRTKNTREISLGKEISKTDDIEVDSNVGVDEIVLWLTHNNEPWSEVEKKWTNITSYRQKDIKSHNSELLKKWPLLKHSLGYTLIDLDYNILFPENQSNLFDKWSAFSIKILPYLKNHVKDQASIHALQQIDETIEENSRDCLILLLLHTIFKSSIISRAKNSKKINWKPSISDAQQSTIIHCITVNQLNIKVEELKKRYIEKGLTFQPIIIVIGENLKSLTNFYTFYDGIIYKFHSFLKSLDITFKLIHVMNFEYPIEGKNVYWFIETFFYNFNSNINPNITKLLQYLRLEKSDDL